MDRPRVTLHLSHDGSRAVPGDRLRAWIEALGRTDASSRTLVLPGDIVDDAVSAWCSSAGVSIGQGPGPADVEVWGRATDLPTPHAISRLTQATVRTGHAHRTRVLPCGALSTGEDDDAVRAPVVCFSRPAGGTTTDDATGATGATLLDSASVFVDGRPEVTPAGPRDPSAPPPPYGHPAAMPATALHRLLTQTGVPPLAVPADLAPRPFLTVLTRTQGTRLLCLEETLTCLAGQTSRDFEVVLACHRATAAALADVRRLLAGMPEWLRDRVQVLDVQRPGRSAPLNDALAVARGRYAVMLDDDDAVSSAWVESFAEAEVRGPGTVLRSSALAQDVRAVVLDPADGPVPVETGPAHPVWRAEFSLVEHLHDNGSPPMTFATPRGVFDDLGHRFDESLDTTEDWDFLIRAAAVAGVTSTPAVTGVYRVWAAGEGSRHLHRADEWARGRSKVLATIDDQVVLLQPGDARGIRELTQALQDERAEKFRFAGLNEQAARDLGTVNEAVVALRARIAQLEERLARRRQRRQD